LCRCFDPSTLSKNGAPIDNTTLAEISQKLEVENMTQTDVTFQRELARRMYYDEVQFAKQATDLA